MSIIPSSFINQILIDLNRIDKVIKEGTHQEQLRLHRELDARYQACIKDWYVGFWGAIFIRAAVPGASSQKNGRTLVSANFSIIPCNPHAGRVVPKKANAGDGDKKLLLL